MWEHHGSVVQAGLHVNACNHKVVSLIPTRIRADLLLSIGKANGSIVPSHSPEGRRDFDRQAF